MVIGAPIAAVGYCAASLSCFFSHSEFIVMDSTLLLALAAAAPGGAPAWTQLLMFVPLLLIFYFLIIRPQQRQMKAHKAKIDAVKRGDQVVTGGGLIGKVTKVDDTYVEIDLGGAKVRAVKTTLGDVIQPGGAPAND